MLDLIKIRKILHQIPELAFQEFKTQALLESVLTTLHNLKIFKFPFPGLLVEYRVNNADFILYRADMDALPIQEKTNCDFSSTHTGIMHACGHDIHMTVLLGLIEKILQNHVKQNCLFLFQPAEEGMGGAESVLKTKILQSYSIQAAYALHVNGNLEVGTVSTKPGIIFGIPQEFDITFTGESSHAAFPNKGKDAIIMANQFINLMHTSIGKLFAATNPVIFHIGKITGGQVRNALASSCLLQGTHRTLDKLSWTRMNDLIRNCCDAISNIHQTEIKPEFLSTYDPVLNSPEIYHKFKQNLPSDIVFTEAETVLTGEDFGFFTSIYPGLLFWLGAGTGGELHSPFFLPNDKCIKTGIDVLFSTLQ